MTIELRASLSSPCNFFLQILKRTDLKECALPSHSTAQSHITTATFAINQEQYVALNMDLLHSRPYSGTREGSDVMK